MSFDSKDLEELKRLLSEATPAPWGPAHRKIKEKDARMIAALRNAADELVRGYERGEKLRRVCDELPELTVFVDNAGLDRTECLDCGAKIVFDGETRHGGSCSVSLFKHALAEFDAK